VQKEMKKEAGQSTVSVVITTFDRLKPAQRAVKSVLSQTYTPLEILLVEDGSRSGIERWLEEEKLTHVKYVRHEKNQGLAAARNTGLRRASGKYVAFLDDDDEWLPAKLTRQVELFEKESGPTGVVYCGALVISGETSKIRAKRPQMKGDIRSAIRKNGLSTIPSSCLFSKEALEQVGGFDEQLVSHVDHDIWLKLAGKRYAAAFIDDFLVRAHEHHGHTMTADIQARVLATRAFCKKWEPEFTGWFSERESRKYFSRFKGQVMWMLGQACLKAGKRKQAAKHFLTAMRYNPMRRRHYAGLAACIIRGKIGRPGNGELPLVP
jgi:glycosyltransferase involved in cell wall biosynthesis